MESKYRSYHYVYMASLCLARNLCDRNCTIGSGIEKEKTHSAAGSDICLCSLRSLGTDQSL